MTTRRLVTFVAAALLAAPACTQLEDADEAIHDPLDASDGGCPGLGAFRCSDEGTAELCVRANDRLVWATAADCGEAGCCCAEAGFLLDETFVSCTVDSAWMCRTACPQEEMSGPCSTLCRQEATIARTGVLTCPGGEAVEVSPQELKSFTDVALSDGMLSALAYGAGCTLPAQDATEVVTLHTNRRVVARELYECGYDVRDPFEQQFDALIAAHCAPVP